MLWYIARRLGVSVIVVIGVSLITFVMLHVISPDPGIIELGPKAAPAAVRAFDHSQGFDLPVWQQYWNYMTGLILHFNLGQSYKQNNSVANIIGAVAGRSALLSGAALIISVAIAIPLGIFQAIKRNTIGDYSLTTVAFVTYSMPSFFIGLILINVFAIDFGWFSPVAAQGTTVWQVLQDWPAMVLPVATLVLVTVASFSRYMRSSALDVLGQDYITVARSKGLSERLILSRHLLRNACLPIVTLVGLSLPSLLAGNLITENVFNYHGIGIVFVSALQNEDYQILLAYTLIAAILTVVGNLIADVSIAVADPRIRVA